MKYIIAVCLLIFLFTEVHGQNNVDWRFSAKRVSSGLIELQMVAIIDEGWNLYSQHTPKGGPVPTEIRFSSNPLISFIGNVEEKGHLKSKYEDVFGVEVQYYQDSVIFKQRLKPKFKVRTNITGTVTYMVCNKEKCLPSFKKKFDINLPL